MGKMPWQWEKIQRMEIAEKILRKSWAHLDGDNAVLVADVFRVLGIDTEEVNEIENKVNKGE